MIQRSAHRGLHIKIVHSEADFARLADDWPRLLHGPGQVYRSHAWLHTWWRHFGRPHELYLLVARDGGGALRGVLPLYRIRGPLARRARLLGSGPVGSDYLGLSAAPADEDAVAMLMADALALELGNHSVDLVDLADLPADGALSRALRERLGGRYLVAERRRWICPIAPAAPWDDYLSSLSGGVGAQFRRRLRWLEKRPGFAFERLTTAADISAAFSDFLLLHRERWAAEGGGDGISTPALEAFHRDAARALADAGSARLYFLRVEGERLAALYGFPEPDRFLFYQSGHRVAWRPRSVGTVLLGLCLRDAFAEDREFDFGHGTERYKLTWAREQRQTTLLRVTQPRGVGRIVDGLELGRRAAGRLLRAVVRRRAA